MAPRSNTNIDTVAETDGFAPAVVVVTPYSTGCCVALEAQRRGFKLICLWSAGFSESMKKHVPVSCQGELRYEMELDEQPTLNETKTLLVEKAAEHSLDVVACICGGEAGVDLADALSEQLGLLSNGTHVKNRRDKKVQQELIKEAGLRAVRQCSGKCFADVEEFLRNESYPVIVKVSELHNSPSSSTFSFGNVHFRIMPTQFSTRLSISATGLGRIRRREKM